MIPNDDDDDDDAFIINIPPEELYNLWTSRWRLSLSSKCLKDVNFTTNQLFFFASQIVQALLAKQSGITTLTALFSRMKTAQHGLGCMAPATVKLISMTVSGF